MENICKEVINPSRKLKYLIIILILILIIFISLFVLNYFYIDKVKSFFYLVLSIILLEIIVSKYYKFVKIFSFALIISLMNNIIDLGILFQSDYSIKKYELKFYYYIFSITFHFISIYLSFETYKETKIIFIEEYEKRNSGSELNEYENNKD